MKKLIILGAGEFQVPFIERAKAMNLHVAVIDINKEAPGIKSADEYFNASLVDVESVLNIVKKYQPDGIAVGTCDIGVPTAAFVANILNLPFLDQDTARRATNKLDMIEAFKKNGVPAPEYQLISHGEQPKCEIPYPVVTKPVDASASRGINIAHNEDEFYKAVENSRKYSMIGQVLVEEYLDGPEFSVEIGVVDDKPIALQVTDKITSNDGHCIEIGQSQPAKVSESHRRVLCEVACAAAKAVGLKNCAGHAEIKMTSKGPKMVEIGGRMGGHYIDAYLLELSTGYDLQSAVIRNALGEGTLSIEKKHKYKECASAMKCVLSKDGIITEIAGLEAAKNVPGIVKVIVKCEVGKRYHVGVSNNDLVAFVVAKGMTSDLAIAACDEAISKIRIKYVK